MAANLVRVLPLPPWAGRQPAGQARTSEKHLLTGTHQVRCAATHRPLAVTTVVDLVDCAECRRLVDRDAGLLGGSP